MFGVKLNYLGETGSRHIVNLAFIGQIEYDQGLIDPKREEGM